MSCQIFKKHPRYKFYCDLEGVEVDKTGAPKVRKQGTNKYLKTTLVNEVTGLMDQVLVHRLVYETLVGDIPPGMQINHKDGLKKNNLIHNLEVVTPRQNIAHSISNNLRNNPKGEEHSMSSLKEKDVLKIYDLINMLYSDVEISHIVGLPFKLINMLRMGKRWRHLFESLGMRIIPSSRTKLGRQVLLIMLYESYFTNLSNKQVADKAKADPSVVSNIRSGRSHRWFFKNKTLIKEIYEKEFIRKNNG